MRFPRTALATTVCGLGCLLAVGAVAKAQGVRPPQPGGGGGIGFRNELKGAVVVTGTSIVNGRIIKGLPIVIPPGKIGWDNRLPPGVRLITIHDAKQLNIVLIREEIPFQGRDMAFLIVSENGKIGLKRLPP